MGISLKEQILNLISNAYPKAVTGTEIELFGPTVGHKPSNAARRARELADEGKVTSQLNTRRCVEYTLKYDPSNNGGSATGSEATCCYSFKAFKEHSRQCPSLKHQEISNNLF